MIQSRPQGVGAISGRTTPSVLTTPRRIQDRAPWTVIAFQVIARCGRTLAWSSGSTIAELLHGDGAAGES